MKKQIGLGTSSFKILREENYIKVKSRPNLLESFDIENLQIAPLLFQTGYLTIKKYDHELLLLSYPNQEVKKSFNEILMQSIVNEHREILFEE
ncbi:MAG: hypothetical protein RBR53_08045 [Desulforegulaceae bacterium]|nr:hypothetical protein [Desulforegulaceae bacterium]